MPKVCSLRKTTLIGITSLRSSTTARRSYGNTLALESPHISVLRALRSPEYPSAEDVYEYVEGANGTFGTGCVLLSVSLLLQVYEAAPQLERNGVYCYWLTRRSGC